MDTLPANLKHHRIRGADVRSVSEGHVRWEPVRSLWLLAMALGAIVGGTWAFSWSGAALFVLSTATVLLMGHSLGMHRKLIHGSYECPRWLEYLLVYCGVLVGLNGPLGMIHAHDLRDYAQRLPICHDFLRHRRPLLQDAWWQLNCELRLDRPPRIAIEEHIASDRFYRFLQRTWMAQQLPWALLFFALGGWSWVFWGVCARVAAGVFGHWLIGYFAHNHGQRNYQVSDAAVQGHNVRFTSLLTMGECWHNNHHAYPGSARLGMHAGEWDPGWWALLGLRKLGWVWNLRLPEDLPERPELASLARPADRSGAILAPARARTR